MESYGELLLVLEKAFGNTKVYSAKDGTERIIKELVTKQGELNVINFIKGIQEGTIKINELLKE